MTHKNHKWSDDTCVRCQLKRKLVMNKYGAYVAQYWVNRKLITQKPLCKKDEHI